MGGRRGARPWWTALAGGVSGTAVMTAGLGVERRLRPDAERPLDYDASGHVVTAACSVLGIDVPRSRAARSALFNLVHWGYGSAVALGYETVRRRTEHPAVLFYLGCQTMAMTLFPTIGGTPPPWRWRRSVLATSLTMHGVYAATVAATSWRLSAP